MPTVRLAPGVALVAVPGGGLAVRTPDGEFLRVDTGGVSEEALLARLSGTTGAAPTPDPGPELARLTAAFAAAGYLTCTDADADVRTGADRGADHGTGTGAGSLAGRRVLLIGDPVLTEPLARCARDGGARVRAVSPEHLTALTGDGPPTAAVWCLDSPVPPGLWDAADRLPERGVAWLRCHREGAQTWLEPLAAEPGDVTSADVRLRRLAATPAYRELAAYWAGSPTPDTGPGHSAASAALTVGLLMRELVAWAGGARRRRLLGRIDLRDLTVTTHPVLPVPTVAPHPAGPYGLAPESRRDRTATGGTVDARG